METKGPCTPSDGQVLEAIRTIRQDQPNIGRSKIREILKEKYQWTVSDARLKKLSPATNQPSTSNAMDPMLFWLNQTHQNADARSLASTLGLDLPRGNPYGYKAGLIYPVRRLVITGQDTPENFRVLFGVSRIPDIHAEVRKQVLMSSAVQTESPSHLLNGFYDEGCPYWAPRPADEAEEEEIRRQLEFTERYASLLQDAGL